MSSREGRKGLPAEQQKHLESEGRLKRIVCDVLRLRVIAYIGAQPASSLFIIAILAIAGCLPAIGVHIKNSEERLPDLFVMKNWNAYLGDLAGREFCAVKKAPATTQMVQSVPDSSYGRVTVKFDFTIAKELVDIAKYSYLYASINGDDLHAKTVDSSGTRNEGNISVQIIADIASHPVNKTDPDVCDQDTKGGTCRVEANVMIAAPLDSVPTRMPYIHKDLSFGSTIFNGTFTNASTKCPPSCEPLELKRVLNLNESSCDQLNMKPSPPIIARHGLITFYVPPEDKEKIFTHMAVTGVVMVAVALAFAAGITFTERPPVSKPSSE